ncbi:putative glycosyltransferase [Buttiauxella brennerae ATCC 51605]|uniref:Putative glycosyltransferase n=1 Tax=Buttiauxella brennerae ATCC 51605 TaxID=1354251 RepID=A0A1B7INN1_9ENTR|nr:glycosyltransferase family 4 protein [Buttiauxella brennerae]OAT31286.1 putative glycosyltransferase [Buttiauxella brennerae ATCC 51605]
MKLCYFANDAGYFALHWLERAQAAQLAGYEVHLLAGVSNNASLQRLRDAGIICHSLALRSHARNPFNLLRGAWQAIRVIHSLQPDLIHSITLKPCLIGAWLARRYPSVLCFPGLGRLFTFSSLPARLLRGLACRWWRSATEQSSCILAFEHEGDRQTLLEMARLDKNKTFVIGVSGVDPDLFSFTPPQQVSPPVVLFAARLIKAKGLDTLVRICQRLRNDGIPHSLIVAGLPVPGDPDAIEQAQLQRWLEAGDIDSYGVSDDMPSLLARVSMVVLPTRYAEGVPRILLEAASCGRPSIAFNQGGCSTVLQSGACGTLVPVGDEQAFYEAMCRMLNDSALRSQMGIAGRELVVRSFTSLHASRQMLRCYEMLNANPLATNNIIHGSQP